MICGSGGSKSRLAKAAGAEPAGQMRDEQLPKCTKHTIFGPLLEVEMSKKCAPLWREAHLEVNMYIAHRVQSTSKVEKRTGLKHFLTFRCRFPWQAQRILRLVKSERGVL